MDKIKILVVILLLTHTSIFANWEVLNSGTNSDLYSLFNLNGSETYYVGGESGKLLKTTNNGDSWVNINTNLTFNILDIQFANDDIGFFALSNGDVYKTTNKGVNWSKQTSKITVPLNSIAFNNFFKILIVGDNGKISKSINGGTVWELKNSGTANSLNKIISLSENDFWVVGDNGTILKTNDFGETWTSVNSGTNEDIYNLEFFDNNTAYASCSNGKVLKTINSGSSWTVLNANTVKDLYSISVIDANNVYVTGEDGVMLNSVNGGQTWGHQTSNTTENIHGIIFKSVDEGHYVGFDGVIGRTNSGGNNSSLGLLSPNGGELWIQNSVKQITWSSSNVDDVRLEYSLDDKNTWSFITNIDADLGTYNWTLPNASSDKVFVKVLNKDNLNLYDVSDNAFQIDQYQLRLDAPVGGEVLNAEDVFNIEWTSKNISKVHLIYSTNSGNAWDTIAKDLNASLETFAWTVPNKPTNNAYVRIINKETPVNIDQNIQFFSIKGKNLSITSPNGGESWDAGDVETISWDYENLSNVDLHYSINNGASWYLIGSNLSASSKSFSWTVPDKDGQNTKVRIRSSNDNNILDYSNNDFTINRYNLDITSPNGGESYQIGEVIGIDWVAHPNIVFVDLKYSSDGGGSWNNIGTGIVASLGTFNWQVPASAGENYVVRISSTGDASLNDMSDNEFSVSDIKLTYPRENEALMAATSFDIKWEATAIDKVNLSYSVDNGGSWIVIANGVSGGQPFFQWITPDITNYTVLVKITNADNLAQSDQHTVAIVQPSLMVTSPQLGNFWQQGTVKSIQWTSTFVDEISIEYSLDNGNSWTNIVSDYAANLNSYNWTLPNVASNQAMVRIINEDNTIYNDNSDLFTITNEWVRILSPNGNEFWSEGETHNITWDYSDANNVDLSYTTDGGANWNVIANSISANSMSYSWTVPKIYSDEALIKIADSDKAGIEDESDGVFTIRGLKLTAPLGGETFLINSKQEITWESVEIAELDIMYSIDNGVSWDTIASNYPASGGFISWDTPNVPSTECLVKIIDPNNTSFNDISVATFTLTGLILTSPNGGEKYLFGTTQTIKYTSVNVNKVKLEYSTNGGSSWITIISFTDENNGEYEWLVPETASNACLVRVTDMEAPTFSDVSDAHFTIYGDGVRIISPNGGEVLTANAVYDIEWVSASVDNIDLKYSSDNGASWNDVVSNFPASSSKYSWTVPAVGGTEYLVKIYDVLNMNISDISDANFRVNSGDYSVPTDWEHEIQTGKSHVVIVPTTIDPQVGSNSIANNDAIGVFYEKDGEKKCAGYGLWDGTHLAITVWGDNARTAVKDGFSNSEEFYFKVWDASSGVELNATITYASGPSGFADNGISVLASFTTHNSLIIPLVGGKWQYISSNIYHIDSTVSVVMSEVEDNLGEMISGDDTYNPSLQVNSIETWRTIKGYQVYMTEDDTLTITGPQVDPQDHVIALVQNQWPIIAYLSEQASPIGTALADVPRIIMAKNSLGQIYYPAYSVNQIGNMNPGEGYKISVSSSSSTFRFPSTGLAPNPDVNLTTELLAPERELFFNPTMYGTGNSAVFVVRSSDFKHNDEVGVITNDGLLVGSGIVEGENLVITVWGDDRATADVDGALDGQKVKVLYYSSVEKRTYELDIEKMVDLHKGKVFDSSLMYFEDAIIHLDTEIKEYKGVENSIEGGRLIISPNPAKDLVSISIPKLDMKRYTLSIFNNLGTKLFEKTADNYESSSFNVEINIKDFPSGAYTLRLQDGKKLLKYSERLIIIK